MKFGEEQFEHILLHPYKFLFKQYPKIVEEKNGGGMEIVLQFLGSGFLIGADIAYVQFGVIYLDEIIQCIISPKNLVPKDLRLYLVLENAHGRYCIFKIVLRNLMCFNAYQSFHIPMW